MRVRFREGAETVTVVAEAPAVAEAVAALFPHHRVEVEEEPPGSAAAWDFRVEALRGRRDAPGEGGYRLVARGDGEGPEAEPAHEATVHETLPDLLVTLELAILKRLLRPLRGCVHLHAAGVVVEGRAVLALGPSGAGKSSVALAWSARGLPVLGDDLIPMDGEGRVRAFSRLAKIDRPRLAAHGLAEEDTVAPVAGEPETWLDLHAPAGPPPGWHPVGLVARIERDPSVSRPRVEPLAPAAVLGHLVEGLLGTGREGGAALDTLVAVAEGARGVRLRFADSGRAADTLLHLARSDRS